METEEQYLREIIYCIDSTRNVAHINDINSLITIAKQIVTRALQREPRNIHYLHAYNGVLNIELCLKCQSKDTQVR